MGYDSNKGVSDVAAVLNNRMREITDKLPVALDTGVIQNDYSLKLNNYETPISRGDYSLCRHLTLGETDTHLTFTIPVGNPLDGTHSHGPSGVHSHGGGKHFSHTEAEGRGAHTHSGDGQHVHNNEGPHIHDVLIPEKMRSLKPGDRVLAAWSGNEAIVIDIIVKS